MSSNIKIQRVCGHCGKEFTAKTTVTQYCSDRCAKLAYKERKRGEKINVSNEETKRVKVQPIEVLRAKEYLTVRDVAGLLGCSLRTVYRLIDSQTLNAVNLGERMTRVKKSELEKLLSNPKPAQPEFKYSPDDSYTMGDIQRTYGISASTTQQIVRRNNIPRMKRGKHTLVPKELVDQILIQPKLL